MGMTMNLAELENEALSRGLVVSGTGKNGRIQKMDYTHALERWSMDGLRAQGLLLPGCEWVHSAIESPQLAEPQNVFKSGQQFKDYVGRSDASLEEKFDGVRIILTYHPGVGFEVYSRNRSVSDFLFGNYVDHIYGWQRSITEDVLPFSFVIDGELISLNPTVNGHVVTDTILNAVVAMLGMNQLDSYRMQAEAGYPLRMEAFDCLMFDGRSLINDSLIERRKFLHEVTSKLYEAADRLALPQLKWVDEVPVVRGSYDDKLEFYQQITKRGGEGAIIKLDGSPYNGREARGGLGAGVFKWKRSTSESMGSGLDAFVTGAVPGSGAFEGLVGSLIFSVHLLPSGQVHEIARISGLTDEMRRAVTTTSATGEVTLNPEWLGQVFEIEGQDVSSKSRSFSHARLLRHRKGADSKSPAQCVIQESILNDMIL